MSDVVAVVNALPIGGLLLVIALGYSLGRVSVRDVAMGPAGATLFVALVLGHLGVAATSVPASGSPVENPLAHSIGLSGVTLGTFGFALFIYSVGFDAAPHFFSSFRERRGWRFMAVGVTVIALAVAVTVVCGHLLDLDPSTCAGLLAGALTSAPTYAAAAEVAPDPTRLSLAFAITYPFGLIGLVLFIHVVPRLLGENLSRDAAHAEEMAARNRRYRASDDDEMAPETTRGFRVSEADVIGRPLHELRLTHDTGCVISQVHRADGGELLVPDGATVLESGDRVIATGRVDELRAFEARVGPEIFDRDLAEPALPTRRIQVRRRDVVGKRLLDLGIIPRHHCVITKIERGRLWLEPDAEVVLVRDDVVEVVGRREDVRAVARLLGRFEPSLHETDIAVYAGGMLLGIALGSLHLRAFGLDLTLGRASGLLLVGLVLGWQQRLGPFQTHVPREARQLVRDLGILLFIGETGLRAGSQVVGALSAAPWQIFAAGAAVMLFAAAGAVALARRVLTLRPIDTWGSICGGLTSSAALQAVRRATDSNEAAISYAVAYAVSSVLATLAGPFVVMVMR